jgi:hypothetical protein
MNDCDALPQFVSAIAEPMQELRAVDALTQEVRDMEPEDINEGATTAPSKRIINHVPIYERLIGAGRRPCCGSGDWSASVAGQVSAFQCMGDTFGSVGSGRFITG